MSNEETRNARISDSELVDDVKSLCRDGYSNIWTIIVGINDCEHVRPLNYAVNDAEAIAKLLIKEYDFNDETATQGVTI